MHPKGARARRAARQLTCGILSICCSVAVVVFFFAGYYAQEEMRLGHIDAVYVPLCLYVSSVIAGITSVMAICIGIER